MPRFPPPGLPRVRDSPGSSVLSGHCDAPASLPPRFVAFAGRYRLVADLFAPANGRRRSSAGRELGHPESPASGKGPAETRGPPTFPGNPWCLCPALRPRRNRRARPYGPPTRSPLYPRRRLPHWVFRGSITRPRHSLSTLRRADRSTATQDSLPAAGPLYRTGLSTRRVPTKGFRAASYISSSFPKLP